LVISHHDHWLVLDKSILKKFFSPYLRAEYNLSFFHLHAEDTLSYFHTEDILFSHKRYSMSFVIPFMLSLLLVTCMFPMYLLSAYFKCSIVGFGHVAHAKHDRPSTEPSFPISNLKNILEFEIYTLLVKTLSPYKNTFGVGLFTLMLSPSTLY